MAAIKVISGPRGLAGIEIPISADVREMQSVFMELAKANCFWEVNLSGLNSLQAHEVKIMDFSARCARSICLGVPVFLDGQKIVVLSFSRKSVENALRRLVNLLEVSDGNMKIARDDKQGLRIEMIPNAMSDDFAEGMVFANA